MVNRGFNSRTGYKKGAITLAVAAAMLVVFAFVFMGSMTRLNADVTKEVSTWGELAKAIQNANNNELTTIKVKDDLVASSQVEVKAGKKIKITSDSDKTIYRQKGNTNFSVFDVKGELELNSKVHLSGKTAVPMPGTEAAPFTIEWYANWGGFDKEVWSTDPSIGTTTISRGQAIDHQVPNNWIPKYDPATNNIKEYYFKGWEIKGYTPNPSLNGTWTAEQLKNKLTVPQNVGGTLRIVAKWEEKKVVSGSVNFQTSGTGNYNLKHYPYGEGTYADLVRINGKTIQACRPNSTFGGWNSTPLSGIPTGTFYLKMTGTMGAKIWRDNNGVVHLDGHEIAGTGESGWQEYFNALSTQWYVNDKGLICNRLQFDGAEYCLILPEGATDALTIAKVSEVTTATGSVNPYNINQNSTPSWTAGEGPTEGGAIDRTKGNNGVFSNVTYSKNEGDKTNYDNNTAADKRVEWFEGGSIGAADDKGNKKVEGRGFFVNVEEGGTFKLGGDSRLEGYNTVADSDSNPTKTPMVTAPVNVKGNFEMTGGFIQNNSVGYTANEDKSGNETKSTANYLKNTAKMTNTAGGVIFSGANATGTISGGAIRGNKADAGGIIVTDGAYVTLTGSGRINKNVGFHHAGAALVQHGGTLDMTGGEMFSNVTWARGGGVWATQWGTNNYVDADWREWPREYPKINNTSDKGEDGNFIMRGGKIYENTAFIRGGAINVESNGVDLRHGEIYNNNCRSLGGAIYVEGDSADYSYALKIEKGYIGNNRSVSKTIYDGNSSENTKLDRKLDTVNNDLLSGNGANNTNQILVTQTNNGDTAKTYDSDFSGVTGNGGGVWLCPVGGTSVFASENALIDNNECDGPHNGKKGGTDFYLSRGNGAAMFKQLAGTWVNQANDEEVTGLDDSSGKILNGELRMINNENPSFTKYNNETDSKGINIYGNLSRDGGGIAANGTVLFGSPEDVYRYDAKINIKKTWAKGLTPEKVTFEVLYKDGQTTRPLGNVAVSQNGSNDFDLELDGNPDDNEGNEATTAALETAAWEGTIFIPSYITKSDGTREALYKFKDPDNPGSLIDPTTTNGVERIYKLLENNKPLEIDEDSWKIEIREKGNKYKVDMGNLSVTGNVDEDPVELINPASKEKIKSFSIFFTNVTFGQAVTNKPNDIEIPIAKEWYDYNDNIVMTQGVRFNSNDIDYWLEDESGERVWVNWPETYANYVNFRLTIGSATQEHWMYVAGYDSNDKIPTIKKALAGGTNDQTYTVNGKTIKTTIKFETKEYYVVQEKATGNKVVMTLLKSDVDANKGESTAEQYALAHAAHKFGKDISDIELADNGAARTVYFPKLVYTVDKYDDETQISYKVSEADVQGRTGDYTPHYYNADGNPTNANAALTEDGVTICNDRKVNVKVTKKWMDGSEANWPSGVDKVTFRLVRIGRTQNITNNSRLRLGEDGKPIPYKDDDGNIEPGFYEQYEYYPNENDSKRELTKEAFNAETKFVEWTGLDKYSMNAFGNGSAQYENLHKNRFYVIEETPDGYISEIPYEFTVDQSGSNHQDKFTFNATNTKLTDVQATKKWNSLTSNTWPDNKTVNFRLKRWLKYDSFGTIMYKKDMSSSGLYISKDGNKSVQKEAATSKYYVEIGGTKYYVENEGYVIIDGMMYALQGGSNQKDREDNDEKVLVTPKDKDGNDVTQAKTATSTNRTVEWTNMPKYDYGMKVSDSVAASDSENKKVRVIRYWIEEEFIVNYSNQVSYADNNTTTQLNVLNKELDDKVDVPAEKKWNDGDPASRPVIKFELWYMTETYYGDGYTWVNKGDPVYSNNQRLAKMSGEQYEYIIDSPTKPTTKTWQALKKAESEKGSFQYGGRTYSDKYTYYYYAPREAVKVGVDSTGKDVYVYVATTDLDKGENQIPGKIVATKNGSGYTVTVYELKSDGTYDTSKKIDEVENVDTLDERALSYIANPTYFKVAQSAQGYGTHYGLKAFNTSPAIEKYVNKDVHENLETKDEVFTYDIMAFVPAGSKEIKIYDPLVKALEFVDKSGKKQSESGFSPSNLVDVAYMNTNNHKAISKDPVNASVESSGTALPTNKYTVAITRNPTNGSPLGSSSDDDYATNLNNYIALENYENKLTVTIPEETLENNVVPETGLWVKVTFKAKIRDDINFENLTDTQREKLGLETITTNDPVDTAINTHTGFKNKASYDVKLINNYKFENVPSNEVTVAPPTSLKLKKKVTGTLGDLTKEFVFKVELTGVKHTDGDNNNNRDYYYAKDKSNVVNGAGQPKAYMHEDMDDQNHQTYRNGFNVSGNTKNLWFKLKAGQSIEIQGLPVGATYKITEVASDHVPSYKITDLGNVKEASRVITTQDVTNRQLVKDGDNWIEATAEMVGTTRVVATNVRTSSNSGSGQALSTAVETVDPGEIVVVTYTNHRDIMTETGIISDTWPWNIILLVVLMLLAYDDQMRKIKNRLRINRITR